MQMTPYLLPKQ